MAARARVATPNTKLPETHRCDAPPGSNSRPDEVPSTRCPLIKGSPTTTLPPSAVAKGCGWRLMQLGTASFGTPAAWHPETGHAVGAWPPAHMFGPLDQSDCPTVRCAGSLPDIGCRRWSKQYVCLRGRHLWHGKRRDSARSGAQSVQGDPQIPAVQLNRITATPDRGSVLGRASDEVHGDLQEDRGRARDSLAEHAGLTRTFRDQVGQRCEAIAPQSFEIEH